MAMAPAMVSWDSSSVGFGDEDFYLVHNVNVAVNPIAGTGLLATVRVPAAGVESVEFVTVLSKVGKVETEVGHAQLRFVFKPDHRPVILDNSGRPMANNATLEDLVLSWEAWRPPRAGFDPFAGLDPSTYALTMRAFHGPVRYLTDWMLDRPWVCYPLRMPAVPHAADEFLYVGLLLGDTVARHTISEILDRKIEQDRNLPEDYAEPEVEEWKQLKETIENENLPENPIQDILGGKTRYHLILRSCVTMALTTLDWANVRVHRRAGLPDPPRIRVTPEALPALLDDLVRGKRSSTLVRIPSALHWLIHHQTVIPGRAYKALDDVGLLQHRLGEVLRIAYEDRQETPYGRLRDHIIY